MKSARITLGLVALALTLEGCVRDPEQTDDGPLRPPSRCASPAPYASPPTALPPERDAELAAACARFMEHLDFCGTHLDPTLCETYARAPNAAMLRVFDCYARSPCGDASDPCAPSALRPSAALGARVSALCGPGSYSDDLASFIDYQARLARPDRVAALRVCEPITECETLQACINAWIDAVER